jgi:curved DNA-binding protein CbpA
MLDVSSVECLNREGEGGMKTHYEQLGLTPQASARAIEQSFIRLAKKYDPKDPANGANAEAPALYQAVHDAYRTLSDAEARRNYDSTLRVQSLSERVKAARAAQVTSK